MTTSRIVRLAIAPVLMALAANCFLKYLWWTACYSAWNGVPKLHEQWIAAGFKVSLNGWSFLALEIATMMVLFSLFRFRDEKLSAFARTASRLTLSLTLTAFGSGILVLVLSWIKQGMH